MVLPMPPATSLTASRYKEGGHIVPGLNDRHISLICFENVPARGNEITAYNSQQFVSHPLLSLVLFGRNKSSVKPTLSDMQPIRCYRERRTSSTGANCRRPGPLMRAEMLTFQRSTW